jgi:alpha 1,2-mannosyltransferase
MTTAGLRRIFDELSDATPDPLPDKAEGSAGIVTAAAGLGLTTNAWLLCRRLAELGCTLPIEIVLGRGETIPARVRQAFPGNVAFRALEESPPGFAIKPQALWTSRFDRCLWLDADNLPLRNPAFLLRASSPARFWPDAFRTSSPEAIAAIARPVGEVELESGQMMIATRACARALWLARELNGRHRQAIYAHLFGDKDTWRLAWGLAGERAEIEPRLPIVIGHECTCIDLRPLRISVQLRLPGARLLDVGLIQHGPDGGPLFLHRTVREWQLFDERDRLSWTHALAAQVAAPRRAWAPAVTGPVPQIVRDACTWSRERLREIEWFPGAFGVSLPARLWLAHRFAIEAAFATAVGRVSRYQSSV